MESTELVQITSGKEEVFRRILAFSERKAEQINQQTTEAYCARVVGTEPEFSCARIDSTFFKRSGRSLYPVTSVDNKEGPQTQSQPLIGNSLPSQHPPPQGPDLLSRIHEMEIKLELCSTETKSEEASNNSDVLARIKALENRIMFLEGVSPEYFTSHHLLGYQPISSRQKINIKEPKRNPIVNTTPIKPEMTDFELNERIHSLKQRLRQKSQVMDAS